MKIILCCPRESLNSIECVLRRDRRREKTACGKKRRQIIDSGNEPWNYQYLEVSWRSFREDNPISALTSPCGIQNQEKHLPIWLSEERFTIDSHLSAQKRIETLERHLWEVLFAWKKNGNCISTEDSSWYFSVRKEVKLPPCRSLILCSPHFKLHHALSIQPSPPVPWTVERGKD